MKRKIPRRNCEGCLRLVDRKFTAKCKSCSFAYTPERITYGGLKYKNAVLTVPEWAAVFGVAKSTLYSWLNEAHGSLYETIQRHDLRLLADKVGNYDGEGKGRTY